MPFTLFGEGCDLYRSMLQILQILSHPFCMQNKQAYTPEVCRRITWAIIVDTRSFFDDIKLMEDFLEYPATSCQSNMASKFNDTTSHLSGERRILSTVPQSTTTRARAAEVATNLYYHQRHPLRERGLNHLPPKPLRSHTIGALQTGSTNATLR